MDLRTGARPGWRGTLGLLGAGLVLEAALAAGFLLPFSLGAYPSPLRPGQSLATILGTGWAGATRFVLPVLLAFAAYAAGYWLVSRVPGRAALALVLAGTVLFALTMLPTNPVGSQDVYHNIGDARTYWVYGQNPTRVPPNHFPSDPLARQVYSWSGYPSSYGPLWYQLSGAPLPFTGTSPRANLIGQKLLTTLFLLGTLALASLTAERLRPGSGLPAALLVGWNPLLQFATVGNANNDIVMVCFALAALYALVRGWWLAVLPLLTLAVGVKEVFILLLPLLLVWMLRRPEIPRRTLALSLALSALLAAELYAPFLAGHGYASLAHEASHVIASPGAAVALGLQHALHLSWSAAVWRMKFIILPIFLAGYLLLLRRAAREREVAGALAVSFWTMFLFLLLAKWWYWPWYAEWLVPLAALLSRTRAALVAAATSLGAMLAYAAYYWLADQSFALQNLMTALAAFLPPLLVLAALAIVPRARLWSTVPRRLPAWPEADA